MNLHSLALHSLSLRCHHVFDECMHMLKGAMWFLKPSNRNLTTLWPQACRHFNVALNKRATTLQVTAQIAERRGVWSLCIHNEWKERKTTQWHGHIRLSETIFKIWVRVQAITSLSLSLSTLPPLQPISPSSRPTTLSFVFSSSYSFISSPTLHVFISLTRSAFHLSSCLSFSPYAACAAWTIHRGVDVKFHRQHLWIKIIL